jgi:multidrug efflux pump subunit AcrB
MAGRDHPIVAIPVSLIGCFLMMSGLGLTFNTLSLFGLVLAIGIVVDDAIVVVENAERFISLGMPPRKAVHKTMDEVGGALIAIALVLCACLFRQPLSRGCKGPSIGSSLSRSRTATVI